MATGIIYVMTTAVPGLIKIGKTGSENFGDRMQYLENNGYRNVTGLKRKFAIEVEDYDEKEILLDHIFSKSRIQNTELFALDADLVVQLLSSFDGRQIYPSELSKVEVFEAAVLEYTVRAECGNIPDGEYYLSRKVKGFGEVRGIMRASNGVLTVLKNSVCAPTRGGRVLEARRNARIENHILMDDVEVSRPSAAGWIILGANNNGWIEWKDAGGNAIDIYRRTEEL